MGVTADRLFAFAWLFQWTWQRGESSAASSGATADDSTACDASTNYAPSGDSAANRTTTGDAIAE